MTRLAAQILIVCWSMCGVLSAAAPAVLTSVEQIRALSSDQAARNLPVELEGTVIYYDGIEDHAFLQDSTGSIFFRPGKIALGEPERLELLDLIRIKGVTTQGMFSPSVAGEIITGGTKPPNITQAVKIEDLGTSTRLDAPLVTSQDILSGAYHDQLVRIQGTVRAHETVSYLGDDRLMLHISVRRVPELLRVEMPRYDNVPQPLVDVPCEITGIVAGGGDEQGRLHDVRILVPSARDIRFDTAMLEEGFGQAAREPGEIMKYDASRSSGPDARVRVDGVVTYVLPGEGFYVGDRNEGLWIQSLQIGSVKKGDKVQVLGYPALDGQRVLLEDAIFFRIVGRDYSVAALPLSAGEAASGRFSSSLVSVEGELLDEVTQANERILFLAASGRRFTANITQQSSVDPQDAPAAGSWIRVSGILELGIVPNGFAPNVSAFSLLARDNADIVILSSPSWFTADRLKLLQLVTLCVVFFGILWLWLLRRQVARQSHLIEIQTEERTLIEERQRIARELHDTLEQQLAGVRYHLNALNKWSDEAPPSVGRAVAATRAMLDHSREEMRRSVFELRSPILEQQGLVAAIRLTLETISPSGVPQISVIVEGSERRLPRRVEFHLMRVVQEALTNAVKHAEASEVTVTFRFSETDLEIVIQDNGRGFDQSDSKHLGANRFGMLGIRERLTKIGATMEMKSIPSQGTALTVTFRE